jgi:cell division protein FtsA
MNPRPENLITVVDAGSSKVCVLVAEVQDGGVDQSRGPDGGTRGACRD